MAGDWVYDNMIAPQTNSTIDGFTRYFLADDDDYGSGGAMGLIDGPMMWVDGSDINTFNHDLRRLCVEQASKKGEEIYTVVKIKKIS